MLTPLTTLLVALATTASALLSDAQPSVQYRAWLDHGLRTLVSLNMEHVIDAGYNETQQGSLFCLHYPHYSICLFNGISFLNDTDHFWEGCDNMCNEAGQAKCASQSYITPEECKDLTPSGYHPECDLRAICGVSLTGVWCADDQQTSDYIFATDKIVTETFPSARRGLSEEATQTYNWKVQLMSMRTGQTPIQVGDHPPRNDNPMSYVPFDSGAAAKHNPDLFEAAISSGKDGKIKADVVIDTPFTWYTVDMWRSIELNASSTDFLYRGAFDLIPKAYVGRGRKVARIRWAHDSHMKYEMPPKGQATICQPMLDTSVNPPRLSAGCPAQDTRCLDETPTRLRCEYGWVGANHYYGAIGTVGKDDLSTFSVPKD